MILHGIVLLLLLVSMGIASWQWFHSDCATDERAIMWKNICMISIAISIVMAVLAFVADLSEWFLLIACIINIVCIVVATVFGKSCTNHDVNLNIANAIINVCVIMLAAFILYTVKSRANASFGEYLGRGSASVGRIGTLSNTKPRSNQLDYITRYRVGDELEEPEQFFDQPEYHPPKQKRHALRATEEFYDAPDYQVTRTSKQPLHVMEEVYGRRRRVF
jgi:uncharacterized membrane protein